MERKRVNITVGSIGSCSTVGILQVAFIVLKLCKMIDWSWGWVLAPIWISVILFVVILIILLIWYKLNKY